MNMQSILTSILDRLDLKIGLIKPTQRLLPSFFDYECSISTEFGVLIGRGTSLKQDQALYKAIGEALERYAYAHAKIYETSNGMSFHTCVHEAKYKSAMELIERDSYICHFYTRTPFFDAGRELNRTIFRSVADILKKNSINLYVARMKSNRDVYASIAITEGKESILNYGVTIGLGCSRNSIESINSSIIEAVRSLPAYLDGQSMDRISFDDFCALGTVGPVDYCKLGRDIEASRPIVELFENLIPQYDSLHESIDDLKIEYKLMPMPRYLENMGYVIKSESPKIQDLFFSIETDRFLNKERLKKFSSRYSPSSPYLHPHLFS